MSELTLRLSDEDLERIADEVARRLDSAAELSAPECWVDVAAAAKHLACKPQRIYDLVSQRQIPHRKEGRSVSERWTAGSMRVASVADDRKCWKSAAARA